MVVASKSTADRTAPASGMGAAALALPYVGAGTWIDPPSAYQFYLGHNTWGAAPGFDVAEHWYGEQPANRKGTHQARAGRLVG